MLPIYAYLILTTQRIPAFEDSSMQAEVFNTDRLLVLRADPALGYTSFGGQGINVVAAQAIGEAAGPIIQRQLEIDHSSHEAA